MKPGKLYWKGVGSTALAETDATDHNPTQYIFFNGARIDAGATTPKYYIADSLGSTALVADSLGNILNESLFFPYGVERVIQQNDSANNYKFTGKERDSETGLDDFGARYYVSNLGRFMSPDWDGKPVTVPYASFGDPQTLNLYSYVENAPLNKVDADGHGPPDSNPSFGGNSLEHYYFGLDGVNDAACAELNGCGEEEQAQRQTEESGDEAAYVERVQDSAAQQQGNNGNAVPKPDHFTMNLDGWSNPTGKPERGCDSGGCGYYGARRNEGLGATHRGADYLGTVGQDVFAPRTGLISSIGYAYPNSSLRMIHISTYDGYSIGVGYASPADGIHRGSFVMSGQAIGIMQNVQDVVGSRTPPHIHIQINFNGTRINPETVIPAPFQMTF